MKDYLAIITLRTHTSQEHKDTELVTVFKAHVGQEPPLIILGEDENANKITLTILDYGKKHYNFSSSFPLIHYRIQYCIKGVRLASKDDSIFSIEQNHWGDTKGRGE